MLDIVNDGGYTRGSEAGANLLLQSVPRIPGQTGRWKSGNESEVRCCNETLR